MGTVETNNTGIKKNNNTPKDIIHKKYGSKAIYRIEEVQEENENTCPGLAIPQQCKTLYRCVLDLPDISVTSGIFPKKKKAEQSAAEIAIEKLNIEAEEKNWIPEEAFDELVVCINNLFSDKSLSSPHPLAGHFRAVLKTKGDQYGSVPISLIPPCDTNVNNLCKIINPETESDPMSILPLIKKAAKSSNSVIAGNNGYWIRKSDPYPPESVESVLAGSGSASESVRVEAVYIPCDTEEELTGSSLVISDCGYYLDEIAKILGVRDSSRIIISRKVGKTSSEMRLYFAAPSEDSSSEVQILNKRAYDLSGQNIYGNSLLANLGYTRRSLDLFYEDVTLCTYYRMLLAKLPDGNYKIAREAILVSELPSSYSRSSWRGPNPNPRDLLCTFCRNQRLSEPDLSVNEVNPSENLPELSNGDSDNSITVFKCDVKILSKRGEPLLECSLSSTFRNKNDAIQSCALKVLTWFKNYYNRSSLEFENSDDFRVYPENISRELIPCKSIYSKSNQKLESGFDLYNIEGPESGTFPLAGTLTSVSYVALLVREIDERDGGSERIVLERNEEFEFEIGSGSVIGPVESCVTQLCVNQSARFTMYPPCREIILATASQETVSTLSQLSLRNFKLEFELKVLRAAEPMEEKMEKALFDPPLSKQRVEFAVWQINQSCALSLVDFGCGSGSLLDSLLEHNTCLQSIVGVDISHKSLTRAAKILHNKLSKKIPAEQTAIRSASLYDGSITDFDARLHEFDIGTCLEVIEHMEEEQASLFGNIALSKFCPKILIVSTPNYEYNPILQRSALPANKENESEEKDKLGSCKFRNHDHKFEWTRQQFETWAEKLGLQHGYTVEFSGVGGSGDIEPGFASQIAVFRRDGSNYIDKKCLENGDLGNKPYELIWEWDNKELGSL